MFLGKIKAGRERKKGGAVANPEHLAILKQGVEVWNEWREDHPSIRPDLQEAELAGSNLITANLSNGNMREADLGQAKLGLANLKNANFKRAHLDEAYLSHANLGGANISKATLISANMESSDMTGTNADHANFCYANFKNAKLSKAVITTCNLIGTNLESAKLDGASIRGSALLSAYLSETDLQGTDFSNIQLSGCAFVNVDFSKVLGLESVRFVGPSSIGIDTIYKSKGKIPESFLRGCGVPEDLIKLIPSLTSHPFDFYSCFISYSSKDDEFAHRLHADLREAKVRVWFAPEDMKIGDKIWDRLDQSIRIHDKLLLVLSEQSIESNWVEDEVTAAFEEERRRKKTVLFPIRLDDSVMDTNKPWAAKVRQRHIGDFTDWKNHDSYKKAFDRLLRDLKASEE